MFGRPSALDFSNDCRSIREQILGTDYSVSEWKGSAAKENPKRASRYVKVEDGAKEAAFSWLRWIKARRGA
jgi:hypothetical protein